MAAGQIDVSFEVRESACVIGVRGELTVLTAAAFTTRVTPALAFHGPVLFDVTGLGFADAHGARTLAGAVQAVLPRETGLYGCSPALRRLLAMLGFDLPHVPALVQPVPVVPRPRPPALAGPPSRGADLTALIRATEASARRSASHSRELLSQLAVTYAELALSSRYRTPARSADRGRLLALSGRARDLSQR